MGHAGRFLNGGTETTLRELRPPVPSEATALLAEEEPGLTCASCGARSPGYFRHCFNCGQPLIPEQSSHGEED